MQAILKSSALRVAAGLVLAIASQAAHAETYKWITFKPQGAADAQVRSTEWFVEEFAKRTGGAHKIQMFWGGSVAKTKEIPDALAAGVGAFGDVITPYFPDQFPLNNAVGFFIPQPNSTLQVGKLMHAWHEKYPQFEAELARSNIKAVGFRPLESYGLLCTKPVKSLADLKGLRIRTYGFAYPALVQAMGATPVSISTSEAYEALERNILDCTPIGPALARGWKYDEVAKHYVEFPLGASFGHLIAMNLDAYKGMDQKTRQVVDQIGAEYIDVYNTMLENDRASVRKSWATLGVTVTPFAAEEVAGLISDERVQKVRAQWLERANAAGVPADQIASKLAF
ncbi:MAG: TRAP transporter substrate-binding protein DctP [Burkholderiaceae bacterium]